MQILIVNGYVRENKGDAALISVLATQLQGVFPKADILIAGMEDPKQHPDFYGFKNIGSMRLYVAEENISRLYRVTRKILLHILTSVWSISPFRTFVDKILPAGIQEELLAIESADIVISLGGGYLNASDSLSGNLNIYYLTLPLRLAESIGKLVILAPQSFGSFGNDWQRRIVRDTLNAAKLICVRENKSYELLKKMGVNESLMIRTVDSGFAHLNQPAQEIIKTGNPMYVGITARNWLEPEQQQSYELALANFIIAIEKSYGAKAILIPQVTSGYQADDDRIVETRIKNLAVQGGASPIQIIDEIDHYDIKRLYGTLSFTLGTRFHSVIFSLTSYVPAIAIEYEHKTSGIMHDIGLDEWVIKIEDVTTERLLKLFAKLIVEQVPYRKHLVKTLPSYIRQADEVPKLIQKIYETKGDSYLPE